jgi:ABC-2 type transport system permease protein
LPESGNPFAMNTGTGGGKGLLSLAAMTGAFALAAPVTVAGALLPVGWGWLVAIGGLGYGAAAVLVTTGPAGDRLDRRGPELLAAVTPRR